MRYRTAPLLVASLTPLVSAQIVSRFVDPTSAGPGIAPVEVPNANEERQDHLVVQDGSKGGNGLLFVWLPGSGAVPAQYERLAETAAELGYDVAGLVYDNWPPVNALTLNDSDPDLPEAIRRERLFGEDATEQIDVNVANSITNRLIRLLEQQDELFPAEGWGDYVRPGGGLDWSRIVFGGHSQGAGHSTFLTKVRPTAGNLIFAGPGDFVSGLGTAPWVVQPSLVPVEQIFALTHIDDPTSAGFFLNQRLIGLDRFGQLQNVDNTPGPELTSHMLFSTLDPGHTNFHSAVAVDDLLPLDGQSENRYAEAWRYMLGSVGAIAGRCSPADIGPPFSTLSQSDVAAFVEAFFGGRAEADVAEPFGVISQSDVTRFIELFFVGCPAD
ncbi:MAG: GC-type dockerin domain-anchored protein [Planctomycetota bacterium]